MMQKPGLLGKDWRAFFDARRRRLRGILWGLVGLLVGIALMRVLGIATWSGMPPPPPPAVVAEAPTEVRVRTFASYKVVLDRNLMQVDVSRPTAVTGATEPTEILVDETVRPSGLPAEVLGTLGGSDEVAVALIRDKRNKEVDVYRVGDKLFGEALIIGIRRGEVEVLRGNNREVLTLFDTEAPAAPEPPPTPETPESSLVQPTRQSPELVIAETGDNSWEIDKDSFDTVLQDLGPLLTQARVVPNFKGGKIDGYKVFAIKEGSLFEKIGLSNGDIIRNVNGVAINTPERALQLFQQLRAETDFRIDIERDGTPQTFSYRLR
jgi:general secretion pathway protein C